MTELVAARKVPLPVSATNYSLYHIFQQFCSGCSELDAVVE